MLDGNKFQVLDYFKNGHTITDLKVGLCVFGAAGVRQLSLAIEGCNKSLKKIEFYVNQEVENGRHLATGVITALSSHPQLEELDLRNMHIGRNECILLATLIRCTTTKLQHLNLFDNDIDDEGIECLVSNLAGSREMRVLNLGGNHLITIKGWKTVATLLEEMPDCNLEKLTINNNDIGDEEALVFANALSGNSTLETLDLSHTSITTKGMKFFKKLLCDTSSINNTYLSNHTLRILERNVSGDEIQPHLWMHGRIEDKGQVAILKILLNHSYFNMEPFFEWELKVLPITIDWFTKADKLTPLRKRLQRRARFFGQMHKFSKKAISRMKLSSIYDFIKEFPMLYINPITRKEISDYTALEEGLQSGGQQIGVEQQARLEEVRRCKARTMRRLA